MRKVTKKDWLTYKNKLAQISQKATDELTTWIEAHGGIGVANQDDLIAYAYALTIKYGEASGTYTAQYYDDMARLSGVTVPSAEIADLPSYGEVAKAINGTIKHSKKSSYIGSTSGRLVKQVSADTLQKNALRDGAQWAWIPAGDTCVFCLTLASRGWQNASKKALKNGHAEHIHANCDCTYAVRFDRNTDVEGYEPEKYLEMYENAEGNTPQEKINSMRRIQYQANPGKYRAQKKLNYEEKHSDEMFRKVNRVKAEDGHEIIDDRTYKKVTKDFIKNGGIIIRGEEATKHLEGKAYAAYLPSLDTAVIRDDATVSDVLEEMYHAFQDQIHMYGESTVDYEVLLRREIDAQKYLLKMRKRYKIPIEETNVTKQNLKDYEELLERLLEGRTSE